jgi:outer membrane protein TolC
MEMYINNLSLFKVKGNIMVYFGTKIFKNINKLSKTFKVKVITFQISLLIIVQGCTVGPDYVEPQPSMPDVWSERATEGMTEGQADLQTWWQYFNDPVLNSLIEKAGKGNLDLQVAASRIRQSRAILGISAGEYFPQVDATGSYSRERLSENGILSPLFNFTDPDQTNLHRSGCYLGD